MGPISIVCIAKVKLWFGFADFFNDTEAQKREFLDHPEKLVAYRKAIEADLNGGFPSVCYYIPKSGIIH
jgi:hypothetical protein